jgi:hypothetical protein
MGRISGFGFNTVPPARLVGACVLAGCLGMGIAFLAAVVTGRTSVSEPAFQLADTKLDYVAVAPLLVTFDRRSDRLDHAPRRAAKADFLAEVVDSLDRSQRQLKSTQPIKTYIADSVTAVADHVSGRVASLLPDEASVPGIATDLGTGPVSLISPAFDAAMSEGTQQTQGRRPDPQTRGLGRTAAGAARSVSGVAGRATGALGL